MKGDRGKHERNNPMIFQLNKIHYTYIKDNNQFFNTGDDDQARGEALRHVQMSR